MTNTSPPLLGPHPGSEALYEQIGVGGASIVLAGYHAIDVEKFVRQPVRHRRNVNLTNAERDLRAKPRPELGNPVECPLRGWLRMRVGLQQNVTHGHHSPPASHPYSTLGTAN